MASALALRHMGSLLKTKQKLFNNFNCIDSIASKQHYKILWKCRLTAVDRNLEADQHNFLNLPKDNVEFNFVGILWEKTDCLSLIY